MGARAHPKPKSRTCRSVGRKKPASGCAFCSISGWPRACDRARSWPPRSATWRGSKAGTTGCTCAARATSPRWPAGPGDPCARALPRAETLARERATVASGSAVGAQPCKRPRRPHHLPPVGAAEAVFSCKRPISWKASTRSLAEKLRRMTPHWLRHTRHRGAGCRRGPQGRARQPAPRVDFDDVRVANPDDPGRGPSSSTRLSRADLAQVQNHRRRVHPDKVKGVAQSGPVPRPCRRSHRKLLCVQGPNAA